MMAFRLNWESLSKLQQELMTQGFTDDSPLIVLVVLKNGEPRKSPIRFKNFLRFMWSLSESSSTKIKKVIIQDPSGKVLFRQREGAFVERGMPDKKGGHLIEGWDALTKKEKNLILEMTIAQINGYDK